MKIICDKITLQNAVNTVSRACSQKSPIPALEGILLEAGENTLKLTGYDLKKGIYTSVDATVYEPGSVVVASRIFGDIVRSLPNGDVTISMEDNLNVSISCDKSEFSIVGSDYNDYPELPSVESNDGIDLPQKMLREMISQTIFSVSTNESRPVYTGELFEIDEDGNFSIIAVDGYRLAIRREKLERKGSSMSFIVPSSALSDIEKMSSDDEGLVKIVLGSKHISFSIDKTVLVTRRLEGEFLNYHKAVPTVFNINVQTDRGFLQRAVERVSLIIDDKIKNPLHCTFGNGVIHIVCTTALGKAEDACMVDGDGGDIEIGFNNRYMLDALKAAPDDDIKICANTGSAPCVIVPTDDGDNKFLYMILPVRLKAGE